MHGLLIASGGIDSTVLMYSMRKQIELVVLYDYGQASAPHQTELVAYHAGNLGLRWDVEKIDWPDYARGRGYIFERGYYPEPMTDPYAPTRMSSREYAEYLEDQWDFLQGRNIVFLARAGARAVAEGLKLVFTAFQFDEPEWSVMGPGGVAGSDTSPAFVSAFNLLAASGGFSKPLQVVCPFLHQKRTKKQIVALGRKLGVELDLTHSCEFFPPCESCHQCLIRADVLGGSFLL